MGGPPSIPGPEGRAWLHPSEIPPPVVAARRRRWAVPATAGVASALAFVGALALVDAGSDSTFRLAPETAVADRVVGVVAWSGPKARYGSAVVAHPGVLLTSAELVEGASGLEVTAPGGGRMDAEVIGTDAARGLAVVRTDGRWVTPSVTTPTALAREGQALTFVAAGGTGRPVRVEVAAVGEVLRQGGSWRVGVIEALGSVPSGLEGAALVAPSGALVGVLTHRGGDGHGAVIVPMPAVERAVADILRHGRARQPWLGIAARASGPRQVEVVAVKKEGPAHEAGVRPGDRVVAVAGSAVRSVADLIRAVHALHVGDTATVTLSRDGHRRSVRVVVSERATMDADE